MKLIKTITGRTHIARIYHDTEWGQYVTKWHRRGTAKVTGEYFTDDRQDAIDTAQSAIDHGREG